MPLRSVLGPPAIQFLYNDVLDRDLVGLDSAVRARAPRRLPVVLTREEVHAILSGLEADSRLVAALLYGTGVRLLECLRLRVKDLDPRRGQIIVREGKGDRDRATLYPRELERDLTSHLRRVRHLHESDRRRDLPGVELPTAIDRK